MQKGFQEICENSRKCFFGKRVSVMMRARHENSQHKKRHSFSSIIYDSAFYAVYLIKIFLHARPEEVQEQGRHLIFVCKLVVIIIVMDI